MEGVSVGCQLSDNQSIGKDDLVLDGLISVLWMTLYQQGECVDVEME